MDILIDPDAKDYDPRTWNEIFETRWMSHDEIEEIYGQKQADKLRITVEHGSVLGTDSIEFEEVDLSDDDKRQKFYKEIGDNVKTVPQVYIDEKRIGGYPQLKDWLSE